jgi:ABC-type phosphate/phosphonate transport system permease subunit
VIWPDFSGHYLSSLGVPVAQTIGMACAGMLLALLCGTPLAVIVATRAPGARLVSAGLAALRAIPDLTLAILAVVLLGLGPAAGIAALWIFYTAMVGKVFAELLLAAPAAPVDALRSTGAPRVCLAVFGLIPLMFGDLITFGMYAFECAMRASIIVGAVGGGGLGTELVGAINAIDYPRVVTLIIVLIALIAAVDFFGMLVRTYPRAALLLVPIVHSFLRLDTRLERSRKCSRRNWGPATLRRFPDCCSKPPRSRSSERPSAQRSDFASRSSQPAISSRFGWSRSRDVSWTLHARYRKSCGGLSSS